MSNLQDKSKSLQNAANLLHDSKLYPAVAHSAYYSCVQLMKHIWLYSIRKTEEDLKNRIGSSMKNNQNMQIENDKKSGMHEFLINQIGGYIQRQNTTDFREFNKHIVNLKKMRVNADYLDNVFEEKDSNNSLKLSEKILPILKNY